MSRIASQSTAYQFINRMLQTQIRVNDYSNQVNSGKKSDTYDGIASGAERLINLENDRSLLDRLSTINDQDQTRLSIAATAVEGVRDTLNDFRRSLSNFQTNTPQDEEAVNAVQADAFRTFLNIENLLSTEVDGRYIFSGSNSNTSPVDFGYSSLASFQAKFDGYKVTAPTTRDANLESYNFSTDPLNKNAIFIDDSNYLQFRQDAGSGSSTITATSAIFSNTAVGSTIDVTGTTSNNGSYTVTAVSTDGRTITLDTEMLTTEAAVAATSLTYRDPTDFNKTVTLGVADYATLAFDRTTDTITAATAGALAGLSVGTSFTIAGTASNNGTFTVKTNDGTNIVVEAQYLTDEGLGAGNNFYDYSSSSQLVFTPNGGAADDTIQIQDSGGGAIANAFANLNTGDTVTFAGTGSNNATYTIASVSADGSTITVNETVTAETDNTGATITGSNSYAYTAGTQMVFTNVGGAGTDTIHVEPNGGGAAIAGVFSSIKVGMTINASGTATSDGAYTVTAVSANGSTITVAENIAVTETDINGAQLEVYAASGTVSSTSYYQGDQSSTKHNIAKNRSLTYDVNAADPAFEKAIRALKIIMQGEYGTEGSLENNLERVNDALYLLQSSLSNTVAGTPPYGAEELGSVEQVEQDIGYSQSLLNITNERHTSFISFLQNSAANVENADPLESIALLLDEQRALEASYQTFSRVRQLSLTNFL